MAGNSYISFSIFLLPPFLHSRKPPSLPTVACEDEQVQREEEKVRSGECEGDILTLRELTKVYDRGACQRRGRVAVNRLYLSMKPSEVEEEGGAGEGSVCHVWSVLLRTVFRSPGSERCRQDHHISHADRRHRLQPWRCSDCLVQRAGEGCGPAISRLLSAGGCPDRPADRPATPHPVLPPEGNSPWQGEYSPVPAGGAADVAARPDRLWRGCRFRRWWSGPCTSWT